MSREPVDYRLEAGESDVENVRKIVESSGFFSEEEVEIATQLVEERLRSGAQSGYNFLFAERAGNVIGYTCFGRIPNTKDRYELYWIAVHKEFRGAGIGKELMERTEKEIARYGGRRVYLDTSSRESYRPTHSFYCRCGYRPEAFLEDFYSQGDGKVIYVKDLVPSEASSLAVTAVLEGSTDP